MRFKFSDNNNILFDFEGKKYSAEAAGASIWLKKSIGIFDSARKVFSQDNVTEDDIANILSEFVALFDDLLGDGATADIFGERPISFYDCYDIFHYITSEIKAFSADKRKGMQDG